jgi:intein/homing endonuclease
MLSTLKWSAIILSLGVLAWIYTHYGRVFINQWRSPETQAIQGTSKLGKEIQSKAELRRYNSFLRKYRRIEKRIEQVRQRDFKAELLKEKMEYALSLAKQGLLEEAYLHLNLVEVRIPRRPENLKAAPPEE